MSSMNPSDCVLVEHDGAVATVTLNRPLRRNALTSRLIRELSATMARLTDDARVRAVVLTGAGQAFCAGLDLRELGGTGDNMRSAGPSAGDNAPWHRPAKPVVAAVNGPAVTGGLEIVLHCDFVIASEAARFGDTHARVGVLPGWGLSYLLPQAVGVRRAREMSLTGRLIGAEEALTWGLVNRVVEGEDLLTTAREAARQIAELDPEIAAEYLALYRDNAASTLAKAAQRESSRSLAWAERMFRPESVAARADALIERGRAQN